MYSVLIRNIQYLYSIYTVFTQYLCSNYTVFIHVYALFSIIQYLLQSCPDSSDVCINLKCTALYHFFQYTHSALEHRKRFECWLFASDTCICLMCTALYHFLLHAHSALEHRKSFGCWLCGNCTCMCLRLPIEFYNGDSPAHILLVKWNATFCKVLKILLSFYLWNETGSIQYFCSHPTYEIKQEIFNISSHIPWLLTTRRHTEAP